MRDPKRITEMLELIRRIWVANPDMRLMQLIGNLYDSQAEYYIEDENLKKALERVYLKKGA
jgi:uncharacterized protein YihD (DUF1040 family)